MLHNSKTQLSAALSQMRDSPLPKVLLVAYSSNRGGGVEQHCAELIEFFSDRAIFLMLRPAAGGLTQLEPSGKGHHPSLYFNLSQDSQLLLECLRFCNVSLIHFHILRDHHDLVWSLAARMNVPYYVTAHDYYFCCANVFLLDHDDRYCGETGVRCHGCGRTKREQRTIAAWRERAHEFLASAHRVIAPSYDTAERFRRYFPNAPIIYAPHPGPKLLFKSTVPFSPLPRDGVLRVAILGRLSRAKGADLLLQTACLAAEKQATLQFKLFGSFEDSTLGASNLTVHGPYARDDLPALLTHWQPHLVWFPAQCPETYSYTLSTCIRMSLPVIVPNLGAFPERVRSYSSSWVVPWNSSALEMLKIFEAIGQGQGLAELATMAPIDYMPIAQFDYQNDYLNESELTRMNIAATLPANWQSALAGNHSSGGSRTQSAIRQMLFRIRRHPAGAKVVRHIPLSLRRLLTRWTVGD